jgi:hypothetical protein
MTINQDEAIARSCGCGEFDNDADSWWDDLTCEERWELGKMIVDAQRKEALSSKCTWTPGEIAEADYVPF